MNVGLKGTVETLTGAFYEEAPEDTPYPYLVFTMKRISENGGMQTYILEVNAWDQHDFYSRAESLMDELEGELHQRIHMTDEFLFRFFRGERQNLPDTDKSIRRVREQFEMQVYEKV